jgi:hypothetical protein
MIAVDAKALVRILVEDPGQPGLGLHTFGEHLGGLSGAVLLSAPNRRRSKHYDSVSYESHQRPALTAPYQRPTRSLR